MRLAVGDTVLWCPPNTRLQWLAYVLYVSRWDATLRLGKSADGFSSLMVGSTETIPRHRWAQMLRPAPDAITLLGKLA